MSDHVDLTIIRSDKAEQKPEEEKAEKAAEIVREVLEWKKKSSSQN